MEAPRDQNQVPTLLGVSSVDGVTPITVYVDPITHRVLVDITGGVSGSGTANEITYWVDGTTIGSLSVATYPSLAELSYVKGVTSAIQTQLGNKAPADSPTFTTKITGSFLTASEILITNASKEIVSAPVATYPSLTELTYLKGVTSAIQTQIDALSSAVVLKGTWDASAGTFPGGGVAQAGWSYIVSVGGTVDGEVFNVNDRIVAITDNASTGTYAGNWFRLDYTDNVLSVFSRTGAVVAADGDYSQSLITGLKTSDSPQFAALNVGHATDTTITRVSAGVIAVEGVNVVLSSVTSLGSLTTAAVLPWTGMKPGTDGEIPTFDASGNPAFVGVGTADQVLTSNGAGAAPTFQDAGGGGGSLPSMKCNTCFEDTSGGRYVDDQAGTGNTPTYDNRGVTLGTGATSGNSSFLALHYTSGTSFNGLARGGTASWQFEADGVASADFEMWFFVGDNRLYNTGSIALNRVHYGFRIKRVASGDINLTASNSNGTQTESGVLTTVAAGDELTLIAVKNANTSIDFYWSKNGATISSATNHTTNLPTGAYGQIHMGALTTANTAVTVKGQSMGVELSLE